jgi:ribose-phosphate pyrophosphokinase
MKVVAGNGNRPLAESIAAYLNLPLAKCMVRRFADMEIFVEMQEMYAGRMCSSCSPPVFPPMTI